MCYTCSSLLPKRDHKRDHGYKKTAAKAEDIDANTERESKVSGL